MPEAIEPAPAGTAPRTVLRLAGITKRFGGLTANDAISLTLMPGEILALLGENGAGKTTLMSILFGHYVADAGSIAAFGRRLATGSPRAAHPAGIGMVHQPFASGATPAGPDHNMPGTKPPRGPVQRRPRPAAE